MTLQNRSKVIFVIAPTYKIADLWAYRNEIPRKEWRYVHHTHSLFGLRNPKVVWIRGDKHGFLHYEKQAAEILWEADTLSRMGRISLEGVDL